MSQIPTDASLPPNTTAREVAEAEAAAAAGDEVARAMVEEAVGGPAAVAEIIRWASKSLTEEEREAFNARLTDPNPYVRRTAMINLAHAMSLESYSKSNP